MAKPETLTESHILAALAAKHANDVWFDHVKLGPTWGATRLRIMDGLAIKKSWASPCFTGYEVKTSRSDFLKDEKWPDYLPACHRFYWACPRNLIKPSEVDDQCGLVYVKANGKVYTRKKAIYRTIDEPAGLFYYLILSRLDAEQTAIGPPEPPRVRRMRRIREFLDRKADCRSLGYALGSRLVERLAEMEKELELTKTTLGRWEEEAERLNIHNAYHLHQAVNGKPADPVVAQLPALKRQLQQALDRIEMVEAARAQETAPCER